MLKGRAASPIRPGLIAKHVLMGKIPLDTGEYVTEAAITDIFKAYKSELGRVNDLRPRNKYIRGMRYSSFYTMFRFAILKGLVEMLREEEAAYNRKKTITLENTLFRVEKINNKPHIMISTRKVYKLSDVGYEDEKCWSDLTNAWKLNWGVGQKLNYELPILTEEEIKKKEEPKGEEPKEEKIEEVKEKAKTTKPKPKEEKPAGFVSILSKWKDIYTIKRANDLISHLKILYSLGVNFPGVAKESDTIASLLADWIIDMEDRAKSSKKHDDIIKYQARTDALNRASEELSEIPLANDNILIAITALERTLKL